MTEAHALYLLLIFAIITGEHWAFYDKWKDKETERWVMGVITVMLLAAGLVFGLEPGMTAFEQWAWTFFGFGSGGAAKKFWLSQRSANTRQRGIEELERIRSGEADE